MTKKNITELITDRCAELGLDNREFLQRLGYANVSKAQRRLDSLYCGDLISSRGVLEKLPVALNLPTEVIEEAVEVFKRELVAEEEQRKRATFKPKAYIITSPDRPRSITICAITNCGRYREILLDGLTETDYLPYVIKEANNEERLKKLFDFFGETVGFRINYTYDLSKTYDMKGNLISTHERTQEQGIAIIQLR
ncbi:hypothetical protein SAMN05421863_102525 [Nitrosomonas communis]|uniref:Uncharacterized protein n=2 Tax=Nitrosomonas communis TaxID=44574 RepID=A0A1I4Q7X1_9PROT|nr:hypothetical protein SAMN05421863_102525 [Nitrosomonas communis]